MGKHGLLKRIFSFLHGKTLLQYLLVTVCILSSIYIGLKVSSFFHDRSTIKKEFFHLSKVVQSRIKDVSETINKGKKCLQQLARHTAIKTALETKLTPANDVSFTDLLTSICPDTKSIIGIAIDGQVIFSINSPKNNGLNFINGPYRNSILGESFLRTIMTLNTDISEFGIYEPTNLASLFICSPVLKNNKLIGVVASEINTVELQNLVSNYQGLGRTGETPVGSIRNNSLFFINAQRHTLERFSKQAQLINDEELPLYRACLGEMKSMISYDYRNKKTIAHWQLIPQTEWGIVAKKDFDEVVGSANYIHTFSWYLLIIIALLSLVIIGIGFHYLLPKDRNKAIKIKKNILAFGTGISILILIANIYHYNYNLKKAHTILSNYTQKKASQSSRSIHMVLKSIANIGHSIVQDLKKNRLRLDDIPTRFKRNILENKHIDGIYLKFISNGTKKTNNPDNDIAIRLARDTTENKNIQGIYLGLISNKEKQINSEFSAVLDKDNIIYDRTPSVQEVQKWKKVTDQNNEVWLDPELEHMTNSEHPIYLYSEQIDNKHRALIAIIYHNNLIRELISEINIGRMGYSFLIAPNGRLLHHPIDTQVKQKHTLLDIANRIDSKSLQLLANKIEVTKEGFIQIKNEKTSQLETTYVTTIPKTNWKLAFSYTKESLPISAQKIRQLHLAIFSSIFLLLLFFIMLITKVYEFTFSKSSLFSCYYTGLIIISIFIVWRIVSHTESDAINQGVMTTDIVGLKKFITKIKHNAQNRHQQIPTTIPTGILINSLNFPKAETLAFTCYIWQRYHDDDHKNIKRKPLFLQATKITTEELYRTRDGKEETIGWYVRGTLSQHHSFNKYPFDTIQLSITLSHQALDQHIMLMPDLASYAKTSPDSKAGIMSNLSISGFDIKSSFFNYLPIVTHSTLGLANYSVKERRFALHFNSLFRRRLINAFIIYLLPLLVLLFSIFSVFSILRRKEMSPMKPISIYSALFFAAIILHRNLRSSLPSGEIMYIEYFFFYIYITILFFVVHTMISSSSQWFAPYKKKFNDILYLSFWPLQVTAWFITTLFVFY